MLWPGPSDCFGGSEDAIQAALKVRCTVCERLTEPSPVLAASLRRWTEFGRCAALDLFMFADITGQNGLFLKHQVVFPVADKNPLTVFYAFLLEVSLNHPSVNWLRKLGAGSCQRPQCRRPRTLHVSVREERGSTAHGAWRTNFRSSGTIIRQNCGFVQS